jgi:very-short-patch-repair endonuclease
MSDFFDGMTSEQYLQMILSRPTTAVTVGRKSKRSKGKDWSGMLLTQLLAAGLPEPEKEYTFHPKRRWRLDYAWVEIGLAVEVDGGIHGRPVKCHRCKQEVKRRLKDGRMVTVREGGRHNTGNGFEADREKWAEAVIHGWHIVGVTSGMIEDGRALDLITRAYEKLSQEA